MSQIPNANFEVTSSPLDTTVQYGSAGAPQQVDIVNEQSEFDQIANGFNNLSQAASNYGRAKNAYDDAAMRGAYEDMQASNLDLAKATEAGLMKPEENPFILRGRAAALGSKEARTEWTRIQSELTAERLKRPELNTLAGGMAWFDEKMATRLQELNRTGDRPDILESAFGTKMAEFRVQFQTDQADYAGEIAVRDTILGYKGEISDAAQSNNFAKVQSVVSGETETPWPLSPTKRHEFAVDTLIDIAKDDWRNAPKALEMLKTVKAGKGGTLSDLSYTKALMLKHKDEIDYNLSRGERGGLTHTQMIKQVGTESSRALSAAVAEHLMQNPGATGQAVFEGILTNTNFGEKIQLNERIEGDDVIYELTSTEDPTATPYKFKKSQILETARTIHYAEVERKYLEQTDNSAAQRGQATASAVALTRTLPETRRREIVSGLEFSPRAVMDLRNAAANGDERAAQEIERMKDQWALSIHTYMEMDEPSRSLLKLSSLDETKFKVINHLLSQMPNPEMIFETAYQRFEDDMLPEKIKEANRLFDEALGSELTEMGMSERQLFKDHAIMLYALSNDGRSFNEVVEDTKLFIENNYTRISGVPMRTGDLTTMDYQVAQAFFGEETGEGLIIEAYENGRWPDEMIAEINAIVGADVKPEDMVFEHVGGDTFSLNINNVVVTEVALSDFIAFEMESMADEYISGDYVPSTAQKVLGVDDDSTFFGVKLNELLFGVKSQDQRERFAMSMADLDGVELPEGGGGKWPEYLRRADNIRERIFKELYMETRGSGKDASQKDIEEEASQIVNDGGRRNRPVPNARERVILRRQADALKNSRFGGN